MEKYQKKGRQITKSFFRRIDTETSASIEDLVGKTLTAVEGVKYDEYVVFVCSTGKEYVMWHDFECCEEVVVEDICGDLNDILNSPILSAEKTTNKGRSDESEDYNSCTWTFYRITTLLGQVVLRWRGLSNGHYSEEVTFSKLLPKSMKKQKSS